MSSFLQSQGRWLDEPVMNTWKEDTGNIEILGEVSNLSRQWSSSPAQLFSPYMDSLWLETAKFMRDAGLPWLNIGLNMTEDTDKSWPFHFKTFERHVIRTTGSRAGYSEAMGYVSNWLESNQLGIRTLQHELRHGFPSQKPILAGCLVDGKILDPSAQLFGLETVRIDADWSIARDTLVRLSGGQRPVIFAASLGSQNGKVDSFKEIRNLGQVVPLVLHVDGSACRCVSDS
ncbi:hypothetical protein SCUP234_05248 [Seiridium cupressi]